MVKKEEEIRKEMKRNSLSQQVARHRMHIVGQDAHPHLLQRLEVDQAV
jgi:hypothetical protein